MARPKKEKELQHGHRVYVRYSDVEYDLIQSYAEQAGMPVAVYVRKRSLKENPKIVYNITSDLPEIQKLTAEFSRIGNNLNQIAKFFNMGGVRSMAMQNEIHQCITELHDLRNEVIKLGGDYRGYSEAHSK